MADSAPRSGNGNNGDDGRVEPEHEGSAPGMPRWVKMSLIIVVVLVLAFVVLKLTGAGGEHGPGRHGGPGEGAPTSSSSVTEHRPPPGIPKHGG